MAEGWSPDAYARFASHRTAPFDDLLKLVTPAPGGTLLDLGCGTGALTAKAHEQLGTRSALGLDSSAAMLSAESPRRQGLTFQQHDISAELPSATFERVISNSAFNWIDDHRSYFAKVPAMKPRSPDRPRCRKRPAIKMPIVGIRMGKQ